MKTRYIGVKAVIPTPMTRAEYNHYRGWALPDDEDGSDKGFLVEYVDGGESNHPDHEGYISWSPEAVFHNSYIEQTGTALEAAEVIIKRQNL